MDSILRNDMDAASAERTRPEPCELDELMDHWIGEDEDGDQLMAS
jgi:hypothetical protein